mmetsp:Transcript_20488/g.33630  ORF Transcript_20488/g.33630 Transcript_20488/m.33630 type:complete len:241 (-) Transcript_20488:5553-6275(-)
MTTVRLSTSLSKRIALSDNSAPRSIMYMIAQRELSVTASGSGPDSTATICAQKVLTNLSQANPTASHAHRRSTVLTRVSRCQSLAQKDMCAELTAGYCLSKSLADPDTTVVRKPLFRFNRSPGSGGTSRITFQDRALQELYKASRSSPPRYHTCVQMELTAEVERLEIVQISCKTPGGKLLSHVCLATYATRLRTEAWDSTPAQRVITASTTRDSFAPRATTALWQLPSRSLAQYAHSTI